MNSVTRTWAVAQRVLLQIKSDPRTIGLLIIVPSALIGLFAWMLNSQKQFDQIAPNLVGLFPFSVMFLLASITTLRERQSGTLERFLTTPMRKGEFILGYAIAFALMATIQTFVTLGFAVGVCGLNVNGDFWLLAGAGLANAVLGLSLGLLASAFASTEFQVIQFMPAFIFPQIILGGLFVPVSQMPDALQTLSNLLPLTHSLEAITDISTGASTSDIQTQILIVIAISIAALALGSFTLKKKTP